MATAPAVSRSRFTLHSRGASALAQRHRACRKPAPSLPKGPSHLGTRDTTKPAPVNVPEGQQETSPGEAAVRRAANKGALLGTPKLKRKNCQRAPQGRDKVYGAINGD
jgi:hypothetical protein